MFAHPHSLNERDVPMISRVLTRAQSDPLRQVGARHSPPSDLSVPGPIPNDTAAIIARDMAIKLKRDSLSLNNKTMVDLCACIYNPRCGCLVF